METLSKLHSVLFPPSVSHYFGGSGVELISNAIAELVPRTRSKLKFIFLTEMPEKLIKYTLIF